MKKKRGNIRFKLCMLAITPLICLGVTTLLIASFSIYTAVAFETRDGLKNLAYALYQVCEMEDDGDHELFDEALIKGNQNFSSDFSIVDNVKSVSGVDATIFYEDVRMLTSIYNSDGTRAVGTNASPEVVKAVLEEGNDYFSRHVNVDDTQYFGYYTPLRNADGRIVGMVFVGKTRKMVMSAVRRTILLIFLSMAAVAAAAAFVSVIYARKIVYSLDKTKEFLESIAHGNVDEDIDPYILDRGDEIGEMGSFAVGLKTSINELVSMDPLTGLYNRRTCEAILPNVIREYAKYKTPSVVVIGDIDFFKKINDTHGHQGGDVVLKELAAIFRKHMEHKGIVVRWGGEEFMFIYERMDMERVRVHMEELMKQIRFAKIVYNGTVIPVTMTFGAAACTKNSSVRTLVKKADDYLYYGKRNGRNQVVISIPDQPGE